MGLESGKICPPVLQAVPISVGDRVISVRQAAIALRISPRHLRLAIRNGELAGYRLGGRTIRVRWPEVMKWLQRNRVPSSDHARVRAREILEAQGDLVNPTNRGELE